jgi:hypothetical protein
MNTWVKKSIDLASQPGYLDALHAVYPMEASGFREIPSDTLSRIKKAIASRNRKALVTVLLHELDLFPIKDSYVAYLRRSKVALTKNPRTIKRLGDRLIRMGFSELIKASTQPKETNRQIGPLFRNWLRTQGYKILTTDKFLRHHRGVALLDGSDKKLKEFAKNHLGVNLKKGIDLLIKKDTTYIIGEAKFLTDFGGHQNAQFADPLGLIRSKSATVLRIAVLDGVVWLPTKNKMHVALKSGDKLALSALLLKDYLTTI